MPTIKVRPGQLGNTLMTDAKVLAGKNGKVILKALHKGAQRARTYLVSITDVDRGMLKASWDVVNISRDDGQGYEVINTAPYAGVVERGIRPGAKYGYVAHEAIKGWVLRKGLAGNAPRRGKGGQMTGRFVAASAARDKEADRIAWAIIHKLEMVGRQGKFTVRDALPALNAVLARYIVDEIQKYFAAGGGTKGTP